ncbi:MAG: zinc ABC transporter substrate-binding protein [Leptolyngbyaceae cyanobacterium MO_188.B28]|nr:zinc ABC transporter substrate-binding protein [Leptolyngbyaceae cyanobacterium MO_188.B28]
MSKWLHTMGLTLWLGLVPVVSCNQRLNSSVPQSPDTLQIVVSIPPQQYFVERVGGEYVKVDVMAGPGDEPHTYEPKPEKLRTLSQADAYLRIRVDFEAAWMDRIAAVNPDMLIVDTTEGIERMPMMTHAHSGEGNTEAATQTGEVEHPDPHIWLSPRLVKIQSQTIYDALAQLDPEHEGDYRTNLERFLADIDALDAEIQATLADMATRKFMVFHPAWGYFAHDYDLEMIPIEVGGTEPSATELAALIKAARADNIKVIFAQPSFSTDNAETIAQEIDGEVLLIDPLARNWLENLRTVAGTFAGKLRQGGGSVREPVAFEW